MNATPVATPGAPVQDNSIQVFVGNLPFKTTENDLMVAFAGCGNVAGAQIISRGPRSLGYGFIKFNTQAEADKAISTMHKKQMDGRDINVELAKPRDPNAPAAPRRTRRPRRAPGDAPAGGAAPAAGGAPGAPATAGADGAAPRRRRPRRRGAAAAAAAAAAGGAAPAAGGAAPAVPPRAARRPAAAAGPAGSTSSAPATAGGPAADGAAPRRRRRPRRRGAAVGADGATTAAGAAAGATAGAGDAARRPRPPKTVADNSIYVANVPFTSTDSEVTSSLTGYGILSVTLPRKQDGRNKGFAYVELKDAPEAQRALAIPDKSLVLGGRPLSLKTAYQEDINRTKASIAKAAAAAAAAAAAPAPSAPAAAATPKQ